MGNNIDVVGMTEEEALKAESYFKNKDMALEWGSGGSTLYFSQLVKKYISIEHDIKWYDNIKSKIEENVELYCISLDGSIGYNNNSWWDSGDANKNEKIDDIEKNIFGILEGTKAWWDSGGKNEIQEKDGKIYWKTRGGEDWRRYLSYILKPFDLSYKNYDVVLVDGRARAVCAYVAKDLLKDGGHLLVHDFNHREYYHGILKYYEIVDTAGSLAILIKKEK